MNSLKIKAPAKLNLFLHVLRKRPDQYHDIYSLFHKVKLSDELFFKKIHKNACIIKTKLKGFPAGSQNLIVKAYELLQQKTKFQGGVEVRIKKNIPIAGGMGGGSSDAAATLIAINRIFRLGFSLRQLRKLSLSLGADVPFFLKETQSALVSGIGEKIRTIPGRLSLYFLIVTFPKGLSTPAVYRGLNLTPQRAGVTIFRFFVKDLRSEDKLRNCLRNDLMGVVFKYYPLAEKVYGRIRRLGFSASQTGSGPTLFVLHSQKSLLLKLGKVLQKSFKLKTLITQSL
jgi:4-diphosphocytidyl-2-C-methyl-D-erythritol kinase